MSPPRRFANRYELHELVGIGGMSEVHLARDLRLHRDVAVKVLHADLAKDPNVSARFRREAQKTAGLNHPSIAAVYDSGEEQTPTGPVPYIVMEYVDGLTLRDAVRARGAITPRRATALIADVCEALEFSHRHGVVHRDVKPANIMTTKAGAVKVVDFGIARALADTDNTITRSGAIMGTAHYLSPEQARGGEIDARSDVYSLGCVLYEIATGEAPFAGDSPVAIAYQHVHDEPSPPSSRNGELPADFDTVVLRAMAKDPTDRYQSAAEMRVDLIRLQKGDAPWAVERGAAELTSPLAATPVQRRTLPGEIEQTRGGSRTSRWFIGIGVLAVLAVGLTVAINVIRDDSGGAVLPDVRGQAVSTGPTQSLPDTARAVVPDVSRLTYVEALRVLVDAGFLQFQQASLPSPPELEDRVMGTNPFANRTVAITATITVVIGSGPRATKP